MNSSVTSREARQAKAAAMLARPTLTLESATDKNGTTVRVGDSLMLANGRSTQVTGIFSDPTSGKAYGPATAEVSNTMIGYVILSTMEKAS